MVKTIDVVLIFGIFAFLVLSVIDFKDGEIPLWIFISLYAVMLLIRVYQGNFSLFLMFSIVTTFFGTVFYYLGFWCVGDVLSLSMVGLMWGRLSIIFIPLLFMFVGIWSFIDVLIRERKINLNSSARVIPAFLITHVIMLIFI